MDTDADDHGHEGIMLFGVYPHGMKSVIIQNTVVDSFCAGTVFVDFLPLFGSPWDRCVEAEVPVGLHMYGSSIGRLGADAWAGINLSHDVGAAVLGAMLASVIAPADHSVSGLADGSAVLVGGDPVRYGLRPPAGCVQVDKGQDAPFVQELICRVVVVGGIQTKRFDGKARSKRPEFAQRDKSIYGIMSPCVGETHQERQVHCKFLIMDGKVIQ